MLRSSFRFHLKCFPESKFFSANSVLLLLAWVNYLLACLWPHWTHLRKDSPLLFMILLIFHTTMSSTIKLSHWCNIESEKYLIILKYWRLHKNSLINEMNKLSIMFLASILHLTKKSKYEAVILSRMWMSCLFQKSKRQIRWRVNSDPLNT